MAEYKEDCYGISNDDKIYADIVIVKSYGLPEVTSDILDLPPFVTEKGLIG